MTEELKEEEVLSKAEEKLKIREESIWATYPDKNKVEFLGKDKKNFYFHNPENDELVVSASNKSQVDIDVRAYSDIYVMDYWLGKPKDFVCQLKKISGKDITNPLFKDKKLLLIINADVWYTMSTPRKRYHLLKELTRITFSTEKEKYILSKYEYQNNSIIMDLFGVHPTEEDLKRELGD